MSAVEKVNFPPSLQVYKTFISQFDHGSNFVIAGV